MRRRSPAELSQYAVVEHFMPAFLKLLILLAWSYLSPSLGVSGGYLIVGSQRLLLCGNAGEERGFVPGW